MMSKEILQQTYIGNREAGFVQKLINLTRLNIVVSGLPGTGKTLLMKRIQSTSNKKGLYLNGYFAPVDFSVYGFFDICWWLYFHNDDEVDRIVKGYKPQKIQVIKKMEYLILDEVFGLALTTIATIDKILRKVRGNYRPFGGIQMIYCGDVDYDGMNASSLRSEDITKDFFFDSFSFLKSEHLFIELKKNYVYSDFNFLDVLKSVRIGEEKYLGYINELCFSIDNTQNKTFKRISYQDDLRHGNMEYGMKQKMVIENECFDTKGQLYRVLRKSNSLSNIVLQKQVDLRDISFNQSVKNFMEKFDSPKNKMALELWSKRVL